MHVILDSNIYLRDVKMGGNQFQELFAYLRRTGSRLVIPMIVFHEVAERYRSQLADEVDRTRSAWNRMRKKAVSDLGNFPSPDISGEVRALRNGMRKPATGVEATLYADVSGVDVQELVRRGVKRVRPASSAGEELRDVILWMVLIHYAKKTGNEVAFISNDANFADPDGIRLHQQLSDDVTQAGVTIRFYREISKFVAENALETLPVETAWFFGLVPVGVVEDSVKSEFGRLRELPGTIGNIETSALEFVSGKKYRVGDNAFYAEVSLKGEARLTVRGTQLMASETAERTRPIHPSAFPSFFSPEQPSYIATFAPSASGFGRLQGLGGLSPSGGYFPESGFLGHGSSPFKYVAVERVYAFSYNAEVTARVENDQLIKLQVDSFQAKEKTPTSDQTVQS